MRPITKNVADREIGAGVRSGRDAHRFDCNVCPLTKFAIYAPSVTEHPDKFQIERMAVQTYEPNRSILVEGRPSPFVGTVRSGWVYTYKTIGGKSRHIQSVLIPGDFVAVDLLYIGNMPLPYGVRALSQATICWFESDTMRKLLATGQEQITWKEYWTSYYLASLHVRAAAIAKQNARCKLAQFIVEIADRLRYRERGRGALFTLQSNETPFSMTPEQQTEFRARHSMETFDFPLTQAQIADCLGLTTIYVNRVLKQFADEGILELKRKTLRIYNMTELAKIAAEDW